MLFRCVTEVPDDGVLNRWPSKMAGPTKPCQTVKITSVEPSHTVTLQNFGKGFCRDSTAASGTDFCDLWRYFPRNSYRSLKYHIYETVKLNQIEKWKLIDYSESEKRYKAFIEHDSVWALIVQSYFYDSRLLRDKRGSCMWDPLWGKSGLLYDCVWLVSISQLWANPASTLDATPRRK